MSTNRMPEGVGKKIVEALKKQSDPDIDIPQEIADARKQIDDINSEPVMPLDLEQEVENESVVNSESDFMSSDTATSSLSDSQVAVQESDVNNFEIKEQPSVNSDNFVNRNIVQDVQFSDSNFNDFNQSDNGWNFEQQFDNQNNYNNTVFEEPKMSVNNVSSASQPKQFDMPPNVSVLKKLILQLPAGVTKQTGAQIIKQTMEALGISMNTVLHEAQKVQDDMNDSIKNCMLKIQEYKNNIKNLEKQGLDYQRQVNQLNDLISLFILTDKD